MKGRKAHDALRSTFLRRATRGYRALPGARRAFPWGCGIGYRPGEESRSPGGFGPAGRAAELRIRPAIDEGHSAEQAGLLGHAAHGRAAVALVQAQRRA
jgi:proline racemase